MTQLPLPMKPKRFRPTLGEYQEMLRLYVAARMVIDGHGCFHSQRPVLTRRRNHPAAAFAGLHLGGCA